MTPSAPPLYTVQLELGGVAWEARVNDAPLFAEPQGFNTLTELPINRWVRNGANNLSLRLRPRPKQTGIPLNTRLSAVIYSRDVGAERQSRREVGRLEYPGPTADQNGTTVLQTTFQAPVPYAPFLWFASETIADSEETRLALAREVERFYQWLVDKDLEAIVQALAARDGEDAAAMYRSVAEQQENTRFMYRRLAGGGDYELRPVRTDVALLKIYGDGRLACLELSNGKSPIYYRAGSPDLVAYLPLLFCRNHGRWVIIR